MVIATHHSGMTRFKNGSAELQILRSSTEACKSARRIPLAVSRHVGETTGLVFGRGKFY